MVKNETRLTTPVMICVMVLAQLALANCGGSTTVRCPPQSVSNLADDWVQAPGEVALALPYTAFGTDEYVRAAVFNHTQVVIETTPVYSNCAFFTAERLVGGAWQAFNTCRTLGEARGGGNGGNVIPGTYMVDGLRIFLSPGTYRLKLTYAIYPHTPYYVDGTVYSLPFQVCVCARCA